MDAIIPIATTAAQVAAVSAEESKTPVIYAAISYPETVELTGMDYVTGTSDALDTNQILDMMFTQNPDIGSVGLLYSLSEPNSEVPIADAKAYLDAKGVAYTEATANTNDEVIAAASSLIADGVDAVFTPTDNIIMAAELAIYEDFIAAGIPHYTGADSFVRNGAFATCGVNYTDLGAETADLAYQAMTGGMDGLEDYYQVAGGLITVNSETAAALAIDPAVFESLGQVTTVTTTEDCRSNQSQPPGSRRGRWPVKGAFFRALRRPNRPGAGLPVRSGGHGPVPKLPGAGHRRPDHRRLFRPGLRRVGDPHRRGTPLPGHPRRHAGRGLRRVCHRLPPDQAWECPPSWRASSPTRGCIP